MVGGLQGVYVILNFAQSVVMPRGMAYIFASRNQGRDFVLGVRPYPGLLVPMLGGHVDTSLIARAESH